MALCVLLVRQRKKAEEECGASPAPLYSAEGILLQLFHHRQSFTSIWKSDDKREKYEP